MLAGRLRRRIAGPTPIKLLGRSRKMMKILIGHDGSQSADAALVDLQRAGLPVEAEALVVSVADVMMVPDRSAYELAAEALTSRRAAAGLVYAQRQSERVLLEAKDFVSRAR